MKSAQQIERRVYRRRDAAAAYGISLTTLDELIYSGRVLAKRDGRMVLIDAASLETWFDSLEDVVPQ